MSTPGDCFAILIKETHKKKASSAIRKLNVHSCLFPANGDWLAVVTENAVESGSEHVQHLSARLQPPSPFPSCSGKIKML